MDIRMTYAGARKAALRRDNYTCQQCGSKENLSVHHIKPRSTHPELKRDVDNLITFCLACHPNEKDYCPHIGYNLVNKSTNTAKCKFCGLMFNTVRNEKRNRRPIDLLVQVLEMQSRVRANRTID